MPAASRSATGWVANGVAFQAHLAGTSKNSPINKIFKNSIVVLYKDADNWGAYQVGSITRAHDNNGAYTISAMTLVARRGALGTLAAGDDITLRFTPGAEVPNPAPTTKSRNVTVTPGNASLLVTWRAPSGSNPDGYILEYKLSSGSTWTSVVLGKVGSYGIQNLVNGSQYDVRVTATTNEGNSPVSDVATGTPVESVRSNPAPGPPRNLALVAGDKAILASWSAPANGNPTGGYEIKLSGGRSSAYHSQTGITDRRFMMAARDITGFRAVTPWNSNLVNGVVSTVQVRSEGDTGYLSGWVTATVAPVASTTAPSVPASVVATPSTTINGQVNLTWSAPAVGSRFSRYEIQYKLSPAVAWSPVYRTWEVSRRFEALASGRSYNFRIRAKNETGTSEWAVVTAALPELLTKVYAANVTAANQSLGSDFLKGFVEASSWSNNLPSADRGSLAATDPDTAIGDIEIICYQSNTRSDPQTIRILLYLEGDKRGDNDNVFKELRVTQNNGTVKIFPRTSALRRGGWFLPTLNQTRWQWNVSATSNYFSVSSNPHLIEIYRA